jgi:predicted Zn-dependent protease
MSSFDQPQSSDDAAQRQRQQAEFEIQFFRRVLTRYPQHLEVLRQQAQLLTSTGRRAEGLACDRRLASALPNDPEVRYHLACSLAAVGKADEAVAALLEAVDLGYRDFDHLESDPDLESLHEHPQFQALLRGHGLQS